MSAYANIASDLQALANPEKAKLLQRFFKTGPGGYGEGDVFLGIIVPKQREVCKKHWKEAALDDAKNLLASQNHEYRLVALLILVEKYRHAKEGAEKKAVYDLYLAQARKGRINNWDLVDLSAPRIVGEYLRENGGWKETLVPLASSESLWERRIAILATFQFTYYGDFEPLLAVAPILLSDPQDLIHKAVGWMLREMGKRGGEKELHAFLHQHAHHMPRTMLRYAIERMDEKTRKRYMAEKAAKSRRLR